MTKQLKAKLDAAQKAIQEVHSDRSSPAEDNLEAIRTLGADLSDIQDALRQDIKNAEND